MSFACSLILNSSSTRDVLIDLKLFLANEETPKELMGAAGSLLMICIGMLKWKRKHRNPLFSSEVFDFSVFDVVGANSCSVETVSPLPETRLEAETGALRSSHPDGGD